VAEIGAAYISEALLHQDDVVGDIESNVELAVGNGTVRSKAATALPRGLEGQHLASLVSRAKASWLICPKNPQGAFFCSHLSIGLSGAAINLGPPSPFAYHLSKLWSCRCAGCAISLFAAWAVEALLATQCFGRRRILPLGCARPQYPHPLRFSPSPTPRYEGAAEAASRAPNVDPPSSIGTACFSLSLHRRQPAEAPWPGLGEARALDRGRGRSSASESGLFPPGHVIDQRAHGRASGAQGDGAFACMRCFGVL
jgi:hypothetical protein